MSLGKKDIIKNISSKAHFSYKTSKKILDKFIESIRSNSKKNSVKIAKFGTFTLKKKKQRVGRNPKTKETKVISERNVILFKASKEFKKYINEN